jgi:hypothetical protein
MYTNNELLFPHHVIPYLRKLRGPQWRSLVEHVIKLPENHEETLAFMLMMVRLNGCMACETDSYRAMRGCSACAIQTLRRYKGEDDELVDMFQQALSDVRHFAEHNPAVGVIRNVSHAERRGEGLQPSAF